MADQTSETFLQDNLLSEDDWGGGLGFADLNDLTSSYQSSPCDGLSVERKRPRVVFDADEVLSHILDASDVDDENYDESDVSFSGDELEEPDSDLELEEAASQDVDAPSASTGPPPRRRPRTRVPSRRPPARQEPDFQWNKVPPQRTIGQFGGAAGVRGRDISASSSPLDCFLRFFTVRVINLIVEMTNLNAERKLKDINARRSGQPLVFEPTTFEEMKAFLGLIIAMGIVKMPVIAMYWQKKDWIFDVPSFNKIMPRDRFHAISRFLHFCDESNAPSRDDPTRDKLFKVRPLLDLLEQRLQSVYSPRREISIDESLISFKGRICFRQFIRSKRARFGMKVWVLAESKTGYVSRIQLYTGKAPGAQAEVGQAAIVVNDQAARVVNDLIAPFENVNHHLYVDNFYSSPELFASLLKRGVYACGTIRANRKGFPKDLIVNRITQVPRGFSDWRASGQLLAQSWVDNKAVYFLSTIHSPEYPPDHSGRQSVTRRGGRGGGSGAEVSCPPLLADYNAHMGGVDLSDQMRKYHNMARKSKAWYRRVFSYLMEICMHNARVVCEAASSKRWNGVQFRQRLVGELVSDFRSTRTPSRRSTESGATPRLQPGHHLPKSVGAQRVCVVCSKKNEMAHASQKVKTVSRSTLICTECEVHLCVAAGKTCFEDYHRKVEYWR